MSASFRSRPSMALPITLQATITENYCEDPEDECLETGFQPQYMRMLGCFIYHVAAYVEVTRLMPSNARRPACVRVRDALRSNFHHFAEIDGGNETLQPLARRITSGGWNLWVMTAFPVKPVGGCSRLLSARFYHLPDLESVERFGMLIGQSAAHMVLLGRPETCGFLFRPPNEIDGESTSIIRDAFPTAWSSLDTQQAHILQHREFKPVEGDLEISCDSSASQSVSVHLDSDSSSNQETSNGQDGHARDSRTAHGLTSSSSTQTTGMHVQAFSWDSDMEEQLREIESRSVQIKSSLQDSEMVESLHRDEEGMSAEARRSLTHVGRTDSRSSQAEGLYPLRQLPRSKLQISAAAAGHTHGGASVGHLDPALTSRNDRDWNGAEKGYKLRAKMGSTGLDQMAPASVSEEAAFPISMHVLQYSPHYPVQGRGDVKVLNLWGSTINCVALLVRATVSPEKRFVFEDTISKRKFPAELLDRDFVAGAVEDAIFHGQRNLWVLVARPHQHPGQQKQLVRGRLYHVSHPSDIKNFRDMTAACIGSVMLGIPPESCRHLFRIPRPRPGAEGIPAAFWRPRIAPPDWVAMTVETPQSAPEKQIAGEIETQTGSGSEESVSG